MISSGDWAGLEAAILEGCASSPDWPGQVAAGIYAGIDHAIDHPEVAENLALGESPGAPSLARYEHAIAKLTDFLRAHAPADQRRPGSTDEALIAGIVGLVGDHLRMGRLERLRELRPDLVLLTLLPYLGFEEARRWADSGEKA